MKKRIAYLGIKGLPSQAGVDRVVEAIVCGLDKSRYQPFVYCSRRVVPEGTNIPGVQLIRLPSMPGKHMHATILYLFSALHALILGNYDLIHLHNVEASFVLPLLRLRYKIIATSHGSAQANGKWSEVAKNLIRLTEYPFIYLTNCLTCVSQPLATYYRRRYSKNVHLVPNGIYANSKIDHEMTAKILKINEVDAGNYILFAAGRIIPTKGCHYLMEAFRNLDREISLLIVGDTSHVPEYGRKLQQMADDRVRFIPFISSKATLYGLVQSSLLFVFPSLGEAMSVMLLEVAALGVPIVCSDIPENVCVLPEKALYFKSGNVGDLQAKLTWAVEHPEKMKELATAAQEWTNRQYLWDMIIPQYQVLYETVSGGRGAESALVSAITDQIEYE